MGMRATVIADPDGGEFMVCRSQHSNFPRTRQLYCFKGSNMLEYFEHLLRFFSREHT